MKILTGTKFDETVTGSNHDDMISAWAGNDMVFGRGGNDMLFDWRYTGGHLNGADIYYGGAGDDVLQSLGGADKLYGGSGADTFIVGNDASGILINGGRGVDELVFFDKDAPEVIDHTGNHWTLRFGEQVVDVRGVENIHAGDDSWSL